MGRCPILVLIGFSALRTTVALFSTEGATVTSLGHRPRNECPNGQEGLKARPNQ